MWLLYVVWFGQYTERDCISSFAFWLYNTQPIPRQTSKQINKCTNNVLDISGRGITPSPQNLDVVVEVNLRATCGGIRCQGSNEKTDQLRSLHSTTLVQQIRSFCDLGFGALFHVEVSANVPVWRNKTKQNKESQTLKCSSAQTLKYSNAQVLNAQMLNAPMHMCSMHKCSNTQMLNVWRNKTACVKCSNAQMLKCPNAQMLKCQMPDSGVERRRRNCALQYREQLPAP